ncbi:MAG: hypothetical protein P1U40_05165 [Coxiellaceae bacterium]|nr:hypothetical protein [Coxiellaceae bacterium]
MRQAALVDRTDPNAVSAPAVEYRRVPLEIERSNSSSSTDSSDSSHSNFNQRKCCEYALAYFVVGIRLAGKVLMSYYGAKKFLEHTPSMQTIAPLAVFIQDVLPAVDGLQNVVMGGTSGFKTVRSLVRTPRLEFQAFKQTLTAYPWLSAIVSLRLLGGAILRGTVIEHILSPKWGENTALITAFFISGIFAFSDIKFSAASDMRLLKRLSRGLCCQPKSSIDLSVDRKAKVESILRSHTSVNHSLDIALKNLDDSKAIRHFVRTSSFRDAYFDDNPVPTDEDEWHFTNIKNTLVVAASHYNWRVEIIARLDQLAVNLPFFYLSFLKNQSFAEKYTPASVALAWAVFSCASRILTSQGKPVESMCDSLSSVDGRTCGKAARISIKKSHALLFCMVGIAPFSVFGSGQILDMPHKFNWVDETGAKTMLAIFLTAQLLSYVTFIAPRIFKRVPACCCFKQDASPKVMVITDEHPMAMSGLDMAEQGLLARQ